MANKSGVPGSVRADVFARDRYTCQTCGARGVARYGAQHVTYPTDNDSVLTIDHIVPRSRGGALADPRNLRALCGRCNSSKQARVVAEVDRE
jgi:5-methylcytosine-specific restriction endonuclease McrA